MKYNGIVQGSAEWAKPLIIGKTTVYIHNNIVEKTDEDGNIYYEYEEFQCPVEEYWVNLYQNNENIQNRIKLILSQNNK